MIKYIAAGNVMLDTVEFEDGSASNRENMGGPATFAYTGIKMWTDDVIQCSNVGADYEKLFMPWIQKNKINPEGLKVVCDHCNHTNIIYNTRDGSFSAAAKDKLNQRFGARGTVWEDFGFMKTSPEEIEYFTKQGGVKGVYLAQNCDHVFWDKLAKIKARDGFKMMWELEGSVAHPEFLPDIVSAAHTADIFSLNIQEAEHLFGVKGDDACIAELQKLPVSMTLFRVGSRGLYAVTPTAAYYLPPAPCEAIDPTGCGNSSTGAALYAFAEGKDPLMVGIMANVTSAQNISQYGAIPDMLSIRQQSYELADRLYKEYSEKYY